MGSPAIPPNLTDEQIASLTLRDVETQPGVEGDAVLFVGEEALTVMDEEVA